MVKRIGRKRSGKRTKVPGPTENPATNLLVADIAIRAGSYLIRRSVEKGLLRNRYGKDTAREIIEKRSLRQSVVSSGLAMIASRSVPGAVIIGGGALAKSLLDRRKSKRRQQAEGDTKLIEQAHSEE